MRGHFFPRHAMLSKIAVFAIIPAALLLPSCMSKDADQKADAEENTADSEDNMVPEEAGFFDSIFKSGSAQPLDIQVAHPNGSVLQIHSIQVKPTETVLGVTLINGDNREVNFHSSGDDKRGFIVAGDGTKLALSPSVHKSQTYGTTWPEHKCRTRLSRDNRLRAAGPDYIQREWKHHQ